MSELNDEQIYIVKFNAFKTISHKKLAQFTSYYLKQLDGGKMY